MSDLFLQIHQSFYCGLVTAPSTGRGLTSAAEAGSIGQPVGAGGGHRAKGWKQAGHASGSVGEVSGRVSGVSGRTGVGRVQASVSRVGIAKTWLEHGLFLQFIEKCYLRKQGWERG